MSKPNTPEVVVVAGGSAGIGRAAALAFARRGDRIAVLARGTERIASACAEIRALGAIWVNNASTTVFAPATETTPEEYRRVTEVAYLGAVHGTLCALRVMTPRDKGCIVQVGSALAYRSIPLQSAYCAAKAAMRGFTDALRCELIHARSKVRVTMVQLSAFNTPQFDWSRSKLRGCPQPVPPIFQPEIAAQAIVRAATRPRREFWVGWPAVKAIVSARLVPGLGDHLLAHRAYDSQASAEPRRPDKPDNLFGPAPGLAGAHGRFDERARSHSVQWWLSSRRWAIAGILVAIAAAIRLMR